MTTPKMIVLGYRVLVQLDRLAAEGIEIPDNVKAAQRDEGTVVLVGDGRLPAQFDRVVQIPFKVGDRVWFSNFGGQYRVIDGEEYMLHSVDDIFAVLPEPSRLITP